jgi:hypothetical protein
LFELCVPYRYVERESATSSYGNQDVASNGLLVSYHQGFARNSLGRYVEQRQRQYTKLRGLLTSIRVNKNISSYDTGSCFQQHTTTVCSVLQSYMIYTELKRHDTSDDHWQVWSLQLLARSPHIPISNVALVLFMTATGKWVFTFCHSRIILRHMQHLTWTVIWNRNVITPWKNGNKMKSV